jgi:hypothetical protein
MTLADSIACSPSSGFLLAFPTVPLAVRPVVRVGFIECVSVLAVSLAGVGVVAMRNPVLHVFGLRSPLQILCTTVGGVAIQVTGHHAGGSWADECFQYQHMDRSILLVDKDPWIATLVGSWL